MTLEKQLSLWTPNKALKSWIKNQVELCAPERVHLCEGGKEEYDRLIQLLIKSKTLLPLNPDRRPNSYLARSDPADVARVESRTFICSDKESDAGPTNNWKSPVEMEKHLKTLFKGCMKGRVMYVIPYCMGPLGSKLSHIGIEITDSPYVVCSMSIMARVGRPVLGFLGEEGTFIPGTHSVGVPLPEGQEDVPWPCNPDKRHIVHFPSKKSIWSFGSGYGGNALLGKKCFALRIASVLAKEQGWLAEHMLILGLTSPEGKKKYFAAAFPSACGKTNLAMMTATLPGWKVECVGDDIAWMRFGDDGRLYAINPENGFFGVAPGTSFESNPNAMYSMSKNTLFTNVALTDDGDVWWEGMTEERPAHLTDWLNHDWIREMGSKAAHPNARFTAHAKQCPIIDANWEDPKGVPIEGIIFGGRRSSTIPLVYQSFDWQHGTFLGTSISSETTAAAEGSLGKLRHDPFAMLPFCGYHMADYFKHWLEVGKKGDPDKLPKIFYVNWFKKDSEGRFLWPGFGENSRVLKWIFESVQGHDVKEKTAIGYLPKQYSLDLSGLSLSEKALKKLFEVNKEEWICETKEIKEYFKLFKDRLPQEIKNELEALEKRLYL